MFLVLIQTISLPKDLKQGGNCRAYLLKTWKPNIRRNLLRAGNFLTAVLYFLSVSAGCI
jgi:hypothetical protein